jgi:uncharacterized protein
MKNFIVTIAVVLVSQFGMAQDAFKQDVLKVLIATGSAAQMELAKDQVMGSITEDKKDDFSKDFDALLPSLYDKMAKVYMEIYTHEEVKQILKFYDSPVGKKMTAKSSELTQKNMDVAQEWGLELQGIMMQYMQ